MLQKEILRSERSSQQDEDAGDTVGYSLSGTDADSFELGAATGNLTFKTAPDYETKTSYSITAISY